MKAYEQSGGVVGVGKPTSPVERWGLGCRQLFRGGRSRTAVLLQQPCGHNEQVFAVTNDFWATYRKEGDQAPDSYGFPLGPSGEWKGGVTQGFGSAFALRTFFMQRPSRPVFVLSGTILERYLSFDDRDVRFGYPSSPPWTTADRRVCQRFEQDVLCDSS